MNNVLEIPAGAHVYLGAPANPMSQESVELLHSLVSEESAVIEAHIPQCYIPTMMTEPRQVLFIMCKSRNRAEQAGLSLTRHLTEAILLGGTIDIFPLTIQHELVNTVRNAGCQIYPEK